MALSAIVSACSTDAQNVDGSNASLYDVARNLTLFARIGRFLTSMTRVFEFTVNLS